MNLNSYESIRYLELHLLFYDYGIFSLASVWSKYNAHKVSHLSQKNTMSLHKRVKNDGAVIIIKVTFTSSIPNILVPNKSDT